MLHPDWANRWARWSSNSGWEGLDPDIPRLSVVETMPVPKCCCQIRLTMTRAKSGFSTEVTHLAKADRRPVVTLPGNCRAIWKRFWAVLSVASAPG